MDDKDQAGWIVMLGSLGILGILLIALVHVPGFAPSDDVLACDRQGGYWSEQESLCHKSDNPAAGLAA